MSEGTVLKKAAFSQNTSGRMLLIHVLLQKNVFIQLSIDKLVSNKMEKFVECVSINQ